MLPISNLSSVIEPTEGSAAAIAGTSTINGVTVDMQGYDCCLIMVKLGDVTTGCVLNLKAQNGLQSDGSDAADLTGATTGNLTAGATDYDAKYLFLDVIRPTNSQRRYLRGVLARGTANAVVESMTYFRYNRALSPTPLANVKSPKVATF